MDDPKSNNSFRKTHTPSSENCEAKEGCSKGYFTVQKASSKLKYTSMTGGNSILYSAMYFGFLLSLLSFMLTLHNKGGSEIVTLNRHPQEFISKNTKTNKHTK